MRQLVVEYLALRHDTRAGDYVQVRYERHPDALATVVERALKLSTKRGQSIGGYADGIWRRWWYEEQHDQPKPGTSQSVTEDQE